jgi:hypothetical protein
VRNSQIPATATQIPEPPVAPVHPPVPEQAGWSVLGAASYWLIQRGFHWLGQKDRAEAEIVQRLQESEARRSDLLLQALLDSLKGQQKGLEEVTGEVRSLNENLSQVIKVQNARIESLEGRVDSLERSKLREK